VSPTTTEANRYRDHQRVSILADATQKVKTRPVGVVLDSQYLLTTARDLGSRYIDYPRILVDVADGGDWIGVACVAKPLGGHSIEGFLSHLRLLGLTPVVWQSPVANGVPKVNLDTLVVREATCMAIEGGVSEICIVGPDCDFYVVGELCRLRGIKFTVAGFPQTIGSFMRVQADRVVELGREHLLHEVA
jgi:hypothetical protein